MLKLSNLDTEALRAFHALTTEADELLEGCIRDRLSLKATLGRFLPAFEGWVGASGVLLSTQNEHLDLEEFAWGDTSGLRAYLVRKDEGLERSGADTVAFRELDLAGVAVGRIAFKLPGDRTGAGAQALQVGLEAAIEEVDVVLGTIHTAAHKQRLIMRVNNLLTHPVFEQGIDQAVLALHEEIHVPDFVLLYRDDVDQGRYMYRIYKDAVLTHEPQERPHVGLEEALTQQGLALLDPEKQLLRQTVQLGDGKGVEVVLISGLTSKDWLGKVVCSGGVQGFSTFALDVVQVMCEAISQRLVDFNRERRHLAQFFSGRVITELLRHPKYHERFLTAREETVAVLYADINSFTKLSEQVLIQPEAIAKFVDEWSAGAVQLLWDHGGVFDKMVGDCIIGIFGPPFFRDDPAQRALQAVKAGVAISQFTQALGEKPAYRKIGESGVVPGLGVATGINLCPMSVGILGPNQDYTGFSSGMNNTARLQSLAGFREMLVMDSVYTAVSALKDPVLERTEFGAEQEAHVKNVKFPLKYRRLTLK
jgi:class 3 adenylate cyclase